MIFGIYVSLNKITRAVSLKRQIDFAVLFSCPYSESIKKSLHWTWYLRSLLLMVLHHISFPNIIQHSSFVYPESRMNRRKMFYYESVLKIVGLRIVFLSFFIHGNETITYPVNASSVPGGLTNGFSQVLSQCDRNPSTPSPRKLTFVCGCPGWEVLHI